MPAELLFSVTPAQASVADNLTYAKDVVKDIAPLVSQDREREPSFVGFTPEGFLPKPLTPETEVTKEPSAKVVVLSRTKVYSTNPKIQKISADSSAHYFPYGYCTYYVSQRRFIPWSGNAISWLSGARSFGYATGSTPQVGAIVVTTEGGKAGHVGMVDAVDGDQITISEMNYRGFGVISSRTISASYGAILGYIY